MKVIDVILAIDQKLQNIESFSELGIEEEEIILQFNIQYDKYVRDLLDKILYSNPSDQRERGFQETNRELNAIRLLHVTSDPLTIETNDDFSKKVTLPDDYRDYVKFKTKISYKCISGSIETDKTKWVKARIENSIDILDILEDKFAKPSIKELVGEIQGNNCIIYNDSITLSEVRLDYIKNITKLVYAETNGVYDENASTHFELSDTVAHEIIDMTYIALANIEGQDQQKIANVEKQI